VSVCYWLFTEGREALGGCLAPLLCLMPLAPVIAAALMGASIRRTDREKQDTLFAISQRSIIRWTLTLAWTALAASLMLSPSGDGTTVSGISKVFGGTETSDAVGHMIINAIQALLWCWTLSLYLSPAKTTRLILIGAVVWCFGAELAQQFVPKRGTSLLDRAANILGVLIGLIGDLMLVAQERQRELQRVWVRQTRKVLYEVFRQIAFPEPHEMARRESIQFLI
jgi:hypothetical protein